MQQTAVTVSERNKFCFGQLDVQSWQSEARQIPSALVVDCRGVYDAVAPSSSSCLGLKDKKSGLEALALKQSGVIPRDSREVR